MSSTDPTPAELLTEINAAIYALADAIATRRATTYRVNGIEYRAEGDSLRALKDLRDTILKSVAVSTRPRVLLGDVSGRAY